MEKSICTLSLVNVAVTIIPLVGAGLYVTPAIFGFVACVLINTLVLIAQVALSVVNVHLA